MKSSICIRLEQRAAHARLLLSNSASTYTSIPSIAFFAMGREGAVPCHDATALRLYSTAFVRIALRVLLVLPCFWSPFPHFRCLRSPFLLSPASSLLLSFAPSLLSAFAVLWLDVMAVAYRGAAGNKARAAKWRAFDGQRSA